MTIKNTYRNFLVQLQQVYNGSEAAAITDMVFDAVLNINKADLIRSGEQLLTPAEHQAVLQKLSPLLLLRPVQYVLEQAWFCNMKLKVDEHTLIPRPETEELVNAVVESLKKEIAAASVLDIGTGSGCIAIAIKKQVPTANVSAIDISLGALAIAKENGRLQHTEIDFSLLDILDELQWEALKKFDVIVSNPPYIPEQEKKLLDKNVVDNEPHSALFVPDNDHLVFYKKIAAFARQHLNFEGKIFLETHEHFAQEVADIFASQFQFVEVIHDMFGKQRIVTAR